MVEKYPNAVEAYRDVYEQYAEEASFLWLMRSIAVNQPHYTRNDLGRLETRLQAQLNGLMSAPDLAWEICEQAVELEGPGEVFAATVVAVMSGVQDRIQKAVQAGLASGETLPGLASAFGWLPAELSHSWIERFLNSKDLNHKHLAITVCSIRRENPGEFLNKIIQREDCQQHTALIARCLRIAGEMGRLDTLSTVETFLDNEDQNIAFWANWAAAMLGNRSVISNMQHFVFEPSMNQKAAIDVVFRCLPISDAREWIGRMAELPEQQRNVIKAVGVLGDPHAVDWLIGKIQMPELSRLAGEAFTYISGIDLVNNRLTLADERVPSAAGNNDVDETSDDIEMDEDENLPWPDATAVAAFWNQNRGRFQDGSRYLLGMSVDNIPVNDALPPLTQRQARAVALERVLQAPGQPLANVSAKVI